MERNDKGIRVGAVGTAANVLLATGKLTVGILSGSISITSDAVNNFSDSISSIGTIVSFAAGKKRPDKKHPFGHGRMEYVIGLAIAFLITIVGAEFLKSSIQRLVSPSPVTFSWLYFAVIAGSIAVKAGMAVYYNITNKTIRSDTLRLAKVDSIQDIAITSLTLIALFVGKYTQFPVDAVFGIVISVVILITGIKNIKTTLDPILGEADTELCKKVLHTVLRHKAVFGAHDLLLHNYGKNQYIGSVHAEIPVSLSLSAAHDIIDDIEKDIYREHGVDLDIHIDPVSDDQLLAQYKARVEICLKQISDTLGFHGFTINHYNDSLSFDVTLPYDSDLDELKIKTALKSLDFGGYEVYCTIDRN